MVSTYVNFEVVLWNEIACRIDVYSCINWFENINEVSNLIDCNSNVFILIPIQDGCISEMFLNNIIQHIFT